MSPEQLEGNHVDWRTDIFAFGVVLYEMLSGRRPFEGKSQARVIGAILEQDPPPVTSLQPLTPPLLAELVARCLAKDPDGRWQSVRDLMRQLEWIAARTDAAASAATQSQADPPRTQVRLPRQSVALLALRRSLEAPLRGCWARQLRHRLSSHGSHWHCPRASSSRGRSGR